MIHNLAFSFLKGSSPRLLDKIGQSGLSLSEFFHLSDQGIDEFLTSHGDTNPNARRILSKVQREEALTLARKEELFISRHHISPLFRDDVRYPVRMSEVEYSPMMLYCLGNCNLNTEHTVSIVGTRKLTPYGAEFIRKFLKELTVYFPDTVVVSGLAYGADAVAHQTALELGFPTVGVVAHGLQTIYPAQHRDLARRIIQSGGAIISQYPSGTSAHRNFFLERNRIIATLTDATIVVESDLKGGAMSTARHAFEANREVFALPGRVTDQMSAGCNELIRSQRAVLLTGVGQFIAETGWEIMGKRLEVTTPSLFPELEGDARIISDFLNLHDSPATIDEIHAHTRIPIGKLLAQLAEMEFESLVSRHPGNRFSSLV